LTRHTGVPSSVHTAHASASRPATTRRDVASCAKHSTELSGGAAAGAAGAAVVVDDDDDDFLLRDDDFDLRIEPRVDVVVVDVVVDVDVDVGAEPGINGTRPVCAVQSTAVNFASAPLAAPAKAYWFSDYYKQERGGERER
jgi:hypothetical protein